MNHSTSWFPDQIAKWFDECDDHFEGDSYDWLQHNPLCLREWTRGFACNPHEYAAQLAESFDGITDRRVKLQSIYYALRAASDVFGFVHFRGGALRAIDRKPWRDIWNHWISSKKLNRDASGLVLPGIEFQHDCQEQPRDVQPSELHSHFDGFQRWRGAPGLKVEISVIPLLDMPLMTRVAAEELLKVAVIPLPASMADLRFERARSSVPLSAFKVSLTDPAATAKKAIKLLHEASSEGADIVLFPELCLSRKGQTMLGESIKALPRRPWLVLAGTAMSPKGKNEAIIYDSAGHVVLRQHKLYPYTMTAREVLRYGLNGSLYLTARREKIKTHPRILSILDTRIYRIAVLICEDFSKRDVFGPIMRSLGIDLLLVPVMDGAQRNDRWTAKYASQYSENDSVASIVVTTRALVKRHVAGEHKAKRGAVSEGIGLFTIGRYPHTVSPLHCAPGEGYCVFSLRPAR